MPHINENNELIGDGQTKDPNLIVAFDKCCRLNEDTEHKCKFRDIDDRCAFEQCIYDGSELPTITKKFSTNCIICGEPFHMDPRYMKAHICTSCLGRLQLTEKLPFTCICCGRSQDRPALIPFSRICDYCVSHRLFVTCCENFTPSGSGIAGANIRNMDPIY